MAIWEPAHSWVPASCAADEDGGDDDAAVTAEGVGDAWSDGDIEADGDAGTGEDAAAGEEPAAVTPLDAAGFAHAASVTAHPATPTAASAYLVSVTFLSFRTCFPPLH
jgi:hypothetical protein